MFLQIKDIFLGISHLFPMGKSQMEPRNTYTSTTNQNDMVVQEMLDQSTLTKASQSKYMIIHLEDDLQYIIQLRSKPGKRVKQRSRVDHYSKKNSQKEQPAWQTNQPSLEESRYSCEIKPQQNKSHHKRLCYLDCLSKVVHS